MSIQTLPKYVQYCWYLDAHGHFLAHFGCLECPWGHSGHPVLICYRFVAKSSSNSGRKWRPFGPFGFLLAPHLEDPGSKMRRPRLPKSDFMYIIKAVSFFRFFLLFGGLSSPLELQRVVLRGSWEQLGTHWGASGKLFRISLRTWVPRLILGTFF